MCCMQYDLYILVFFMAVTQTFLCLRANKLASHSHVLTNVIWWDSLPVFIREDDFRDKHGLSFVSTIFF